MKPYIGTPTSRIDGRAKVTGAAQYAGEFNVPGLVYGSLVTSTISKGRIARIDVTRALCRSKGVLDVLHSREPAGKWPAKPTRPMMDDVALGGSPFSPLYDDKVKFNHQPIALVLAEEWEIAQFAASLMGVEYEAEAHATDLHARLDEAVVIKKPNKRRGDAAKAHAAAAVRHEAEYFIPTEHHNPMEFVLASTVVWEGSGKLTSLRQDARGAERATLRLQSVWHESGRCARDVALRRRRIRLRLAPAIRGGASRAGGKGAEALGATRADSRPDVWAWLSARDD